MGRVAVLTSLKDMSDEDAVVQWYAARDWFLGLHERMENPSKGLELARQCKHDEAKWLCKLFPDGVPNCPNRIQEVFLAQGNDAKALCFAAFFVPYCGFPERVLLERQCC